ncbi:unnamed protein product [Tetraodon nigroviridis]|uniref:(spotted green pufferfish) hypothetical protein n=1 Tax=Tetraodon nigroviridis TaxID=99883 RepID=Q4RIX4_TETNG|nr:unnamed protein product [Tetraodon nigroviridis]
MSTWQEYWMSQNPELIVRCCRSTLTSRFASLDVWIRFTRQEKPSASTTEKEKQPQLNSTTRLRRS